MLVDLKLPADRLGFCTLHEARRERLVDPRVHRHRELECNLIMRGRCDYVVGDRHLRLAEQHLAWFFPGQDHMVMRQSENFAMWVLVFDPRLATETAASIDADPLVEDDPQGRFERRIAAGAAGRLRGICERLLDAQLADTHFNQGLRWFLLEAWIAFAAGDEVDAGDRIDPAVEQAMNLLQDPHGPETLPELAAACGVSSSWLSRRFHAQLGSTIGVYRNRQRLQRCLALAGRDGRNLTEAAFAAGFTSYGQFYHVCRQLTGNGPRQLLRERA